MNTKKSIIRLEGLQKNSSNSDFEDSFFLNYEYFKESLYIKYGYFEDSRWVKYEYFEVSLYVK